MSLLTIDHTQRSSWQMCKRAYLLRHICGIRKATADAPGFAFGTAFHASSEVLDLTKDVNLAMETFTQLFNFPDDKVRTLVRARNLLVAYEKFIKTKGWKFLQQTRDTLEIAFNEPLTDRINYAGRCDRQFDNGDIGEWKTTYYLYNSSGNPMPYLQQWWGHNSIRGYAWARKAKRVHVLGVGVYPQKESRGGKEYACVESLAIPIKLWEIEQFEREIKLIGEEIIQACHFNNFDIGTNFESNLEKMFRDQLWHWFPTNTSRCYFNINNPCQFLGLCTRNVPRGLVDMNYVIDPFLPWLEEKKNGTNFLPAT